MTEELQDASGELPGLLAQQRKEKVRTRLAFLLLDVFLGGFIVGVVLLTTLGRPQSTVTSAGAGALPYMLVEYTWENSNLVLAPVAKYEGETLSDFGLAALWSSEGGSAWPGYDAKTGQVRLRGKYLSLFMDGFDPRAGFLKMRTTLEENGRMVERFYGRLLLISPCPGRWEFGLRVIETSSNVEGVDSSIVADVRVIWGGYSERQNAQRRIPRVLQEESATEAVVRARNSFAALEYRTRQQPEILPAPRDGPMPHCP